MWLDNLKELKKEKGMSVKQIAEATSLPERTVARIFSGDTDNPYVDTLHRIVTVLGGSLDAIFADTKAVVGNADLTALQSEIEALKAENARLKGENMDLKEENTSSKAEISILKLKLEHKEEIIALHNYYNKLKTSN